MKTFATASVLLLAAASIASPSLAQTSSRSRPAATERGTVVSVTPISEQVAVPRRMCHDEEVAVRQQPSGAGALFGAIVGGALGNSVGAGVGRAAATAVGVMGGAVAGNAMEASTAPAQAQTVRRCSDESAYEERITSYSVVYEYGGRQYTTVMRRDPGRYVLVQVQAAVEGDDELPPPVAPPPRARSVPPPPESSSRRPPPVYVERAPYYPSEPERVYVPYPVPAPGYYYYDAPPPPPPSAANFGVGLVVGALIGYGVGRDHRGHGRYWRR